MSKKELKRQAKEQEQRLQEKQAEDEADSLRESVKKEVQECNDVKEAIESVKRSIENEVATREQLEKERRECIIRAQQLRSRAKELGELIKRERTTRKEVDGYESEDSDEEEEDDDLAFILTTPVSNSASLKAAPSSSKSACMLDVGMDVMMGELRGASLDEMLAEGSTQERQRALTFTRARTELMSQMSVAQSFQAIDAVRKDDERHHAQYQHHLKVMMSWITRERDLESLNELFEGTEYVSALEELLVGEQGVLETIEDVATRYVSPLCGAASSLSFSLAEVFSNVACLRKLHKQCIDVCLKSKGGDGVDTAALCKVLKALASAYEQYAQQRDESRALLQNRDIATEIGEVTGESAAGPRVNKMLQIPVEYFKKYPARLQPLLSAANEKCDEFVDLCDAVCAMEDAVETCGLSPATVPVHLKPQRQRLVEVSRRFDWSGAASIDRDLGGGKRKLLLEGKFSKVVEHGTARRTVAYSLYLFSDALLVTRPAMFSKKEWFKQYYPLQSLVVWDVPDQAASLNKSVFEIVRIGTKNSKTVVSAESDAEKGKWVDSINEAICAVPCTADALHWALR